MMTPIFLNQPTAQCFNPNQDQLTEHEQLQALASSPSYQLHLGQGLRMSDQSPASDQLEVSKNMFFDGESPSYGARVTSTNNYGSSHSNELFIFKQREDQEPSNINGCRGVAADNGSSLRWMSSKMRMMRRMISSNGRKTDPKSGSRISSGTANLDQGPQFNINNDVSYSNNVIRVCSDCNTTKTPLWRSGPQGPKSLCNACGIRQRKARKAAMEAAATDNSCEASSSTSAKTTTKLMTNKVKNKSRATSNTCVSQQSNKKQTPCKKQQPNPLADNDHNNSSTSTSSSRRRLLFQDFAVNLLSQNATFHRMFPQDEEEGALLLMALSYGLIHN